MTIAGPAAPSMSSPGSWPALGSTLLLGRSVEELASGGRVTDGGLLVEPEHGGQVKGVGPVGEGPLE